MANALLLLCEAVLYFGAMVARRKQSVVATSQTRATPCSVSIGVATVGGQIHCLADLYAVADQRLYAAKTGGRDRVVGDVSQEPLDSPGILRA